VYVAMIKEADFDESTSSLASLKLFRELCDLLNAQPVNFWDPFIEVSDDCAAAAWSTDIRAKNRIYAAFLKLLRKLQDKLQDQKLINEVRFADSNKGGACAGIVITPSADFSSRTEHLADSLSCVMLYNNLKPRNDGGNCNQAQTAMIFLGAVIRFKAVYIPDSSDQGCENMGAAKTQSKRQKRVGAATTQSKSQPSKRVRDEGGQDNFVDLRHLTNDEPAQPLAPSAAATTQSKSQPLKRVRDEGGQDNFVDLRHLTNDEPAQPLAPSAAATTQSKSQPLQRVRDEGDWDNFVDLTNDERAQPPPPQSDANKWEECLEVGPGDPGRYPV